MLGSVRKKSGTAAPDWAFDLKCDRAVPEEVARSEWLRNFVPRGRNRRRKPTPRGVSQESRALFASRPKEKIARYPRSDQDFHASFPRLQAARTNRQSTAKATTVQETDAPLAIAN